MALQHQLFWRFFFFPFLRLSLLCHSRPSCANQLINNLMHMLQLCSTWTWPDTWNLWQPHVIIQAIIFQVWPPDSFPESNLYYTHPLTSWVSSLIWKLYIGAKVRLSGCYFYFTMCMLERSGSTTHRSIWCAGSYFVPCGVPAHLEDASCPPVAVN